MSDYIRSIKQPRSLKERDDIACVLACHLREAHQLPYAHSKRIVNSSNVKKLVTQLHNEGITKFTVKNDLLQWFCVNRDFLCSLNDHSERFVDITSSIPVSLFLPFISNDLLVSLCSSYFHAPARLQNFSVSWTNQGHNAQPLNGQLFHRDRDDFKTLRHYIYLSDVTPHDGPHLYIRNSHTFSSCKSLRLSETGFKSLDQVHGFYSSEEIFNTLSYPSSLLDILVGKSGFSFIEDSGGIHSGSVPSTRDNHRLMMCITWALGRGKQFETLGKSRLLSLQKAVLQKNDLSDAIKYAVWL